MVTFNGNKVKCDTLDYKLRTSLVITIMSELYLVYVWVEGFSIDSTTQGDSPTSKALKSFPWVREGNQSFARGI